MRAWWYYQGGGRYEDPFPEGAGESAPEAGKSGPATGAEQVRGDPFGPPAVSERRAHHPAGIGAGGGRSLDWLCGRTGRPGHEPEVHGRIWRVMRTALA